MRVDGQWLKDRAGRTLILRGVNLGGSSKVPVRPDGATWRSEGFYDWRDVSFVGRPFPLGEADEHFRRLRSWGMRLLRFLVSWEAIEHAGPGRYDRDYLGYVRTVMQAAGRHGLWVCVDPHQDVWSRWSGGDGAPAWTLTEVGFCLEGLHASGAAILHQRSGESYLPMSWPTNENRLACATMFTLFFGGAEFAPQLRIRGASAQEFLQGRYIAAMCELAKCLEGLENLAGFGAMNEPSLGFIGLEDLARLERAPMRRGLMPTPFQAMRAGSGYPTSCDRWSLGLAGQHRVGRGRLNPEGASAWAAGAECVWRRAGVWGISGGEPALLRPGHFRADGELADRYLKPFVTRLVGEIRRVLPGLSYFAEGVPYGAQPGWKPGELGALVNAPHWYDPITLVTKRSQELFTVDPVSRRISFGRRGIRRSFCAQLARHRDESETLMGGVPTVIGEFGLPFDMNRRAAYHRGSFRAHERALASYYDAVDANLLGATIWNYTADNDNDHGDQWNGEDMSIYSRDLSPGASGASDPSGGRAVRGFCRPYAESIAGVPCSMAFDTRSRRFELRYRPDPAIEAPTVIYVPSVQYPRGYRVELSDSGSLREERDEAGQRLLLHRVRATPEGREGWVILRPAR